MIETFTVLDVTNQRARISIGGYRGGKVHSFDTLRAAKQRHSLIANMYPQNEYGILKMSINALGNATTERIL